MSDDLRNFFNDRITQEIEKNAQIGLFTKYDDLQKASDEKIAQLNKEIKAIDPKRERLFWDARKGSTVFEDVKDVAISGLQGAESLLKIPSMVVDKVRTGNFYGPATQEISKWQDDQENMKSSLSQYKSMKKGEVATADGKAVSDALGGGVTGTVAGVATEFGSAFWEAMKDPSSIPEFLAQQAAQLGVTGKVGRVAETGAKAVAKAAPKLAATKAGQMALEKSATAGAVGFSSGLQGIDVGSDTMQRLMTLPDEVWAQNPEFLTLSEQIGAEQAKQNIASDLASKATLAAAGTSLLTQAVPGGTSVEKALVGKAKLSPTSVPRAFAGEAFQEGGEEGSGQFAGNVAVKQINPNQSLSEGIGNAAGQGAFMGGLLGGGFQGINNAATAAANINNSTVDPSKKQAYTAAVESGDVSALVDPNNAAYDPSMAVDALQANAGLEGKTPETKQASFDQAAKIIDDVSARIETLKTGLAQTTKESLEKEVADASAVLAQATADNNTERASAAQAWLTGAQEKLQRFDPATAQEKAADFEAKIAAAEAALAKSQESLAKFNTELQVKELDAELEAENITAAAATGDVKTAQASAEKIINLSMAAPERLTTARADQLANAEGLTDTQREYFRSFSAARAQENSLLKQGDVSQQVYFGKAAQPEKGLPRMLGIKDYRAEIGTALASGNKKSASTMLGFLNKFAADHQQKATLATEALAAVKSDGQTRRLVSNGNGTWSVKMGAWPSEQARLDNGGLTIHGGSNKVVSELRTESDALNAAQAELTAAYNNKFGGADVKNVSQPATNQANSPAPEKEATTEASTGEGSRDGRPAEVASVQSDETSAVTETTEEAPASAANTEKTQSTEKSSTAEAEAQTDVAESPEVTSETDVSPGALQATKLKAEEGSSYERLKFGDLFVQKKGDEAGSVRPLVAVQNFMSMLAAGAVSVLDFVKGQDKTTPTQDRLLTVMKERLDKWAPIITANLKPGHSEYFNHEDPIRFLIDKWDGKTSDVEENVKAAIVAAVFSYVADQASRVRINGPEAINAILNRQGDAAVEPLAFKMLSTVGVYRHILADTLGSRVIESLGIAGNSSVAGQDLEAKLRASLGAHVLKLMEDVGLVEATAYTNEQMSKLDDRIQGFGANEGHVFYRIKEDKNRELVGDGKTIHEAMRGTESLLNRLFGMEEPIKFAYLAPSEAVQQKTKAGMNIPKFLKEVVFGQKAKEPWVINEVPYGVLAQFDQEQAHEIFGVETVTSENTHADDWMSKQAKNEGLIREYKLFSEFIGEFIATSKDVLKTPFHLGYSVWDQQRVGVETSAVNPQGSKIVRWLITAPSWTTSIKLDDAKMMQTFMLKAAEGFGIKPEKGASDKAMERLKGMLAEPRIAAGLKAMQKAITKKELSDAEKQFILNAVADGRQRAHTFAALVALAQYMNATENGKPDFTTNLMGEVDGVSNGTILNHVFYGAAQSAEALNKMLESGGIYALGSKFRQYNLWRGTPGNLDTYEAAAASTAEGVVTKDKAVVGALWITGGALVQEDGSVGSDGRDLMKIGINPLNYGSGIKSIQSKVAGSYIETIREKLAKMSSDEVTQAEVDEYITQLNVVLKAGNAKPLVVGKPIAYYMGYETPTFTEQQVDALKQVYGSVMGETMSTVIGDKFASLLGATKMAVRTSNAMFSIYQGLYAAERNAVLADIPKNRAGQPIRDLTKAEEKAIQKKLKAVLPAVNTAMSAAENNPAAGVLMADRESTTSNAPMYGMEVKFGTKLKSGKASMGVKAQGGQLTSPGVAFVANTTQSGDSRISHLSQEGRQVFNMHDALGDGVGTLGETAAALNQNTWKTLLEYSPLMEAHKGLMRMVQGVLAMQAAGELTPQAIEEIKASFAKSTKDKASADWLLEQVQETFAQAIQAETTKLTAMAEWAVVDQYTFDGGSYEVTDADRASAKAKLAALPAGMSPEETAQIVDFASAVFGGKAQAAAPVQTVFGKVSAAKVASTPALVNVFTANNGEPTVDQMHEFLKGKLTGVNRKLLELAVRTIKKSNPGLKLKLVTPQSQEGDVLAMPTAASHAWYVDNGQGQTEAYFLSPEFKDSGLTAESVLHELVHAAIAQIVANPTAEAQALVAELEALRIEAARFIADRGLTQFTAATADLQEFLAWGMTNKGFQDNVLRKIQMQERTTQGNVLVTAMKKFVDTLSGLLFRKEPEITNGLLVLIEDTSGLFAAAAGTQGNTAINQSMAANPASQATGQWTTQEVFQALDNGSVSPVFGMHLGKLLSGMIQSLHGPYGAFKNAMRKTEAGNPMAVWLKAIETGNAPFASDLVNTGFTASAQEDFVMEQVEATVATALDVNDVTTKPAYRELYKLYVEAKARLTVQDFINAGLTAADHDFVFGVQTDANGRSRYMSRFAALGLASEKFNGLLKFETTTGRGHLGNHKSIFDRLVRWFEHVLAVFNAKATKTFIGQQADAKLEALVDRLMDIEAKHRFAAEAKDSKFNQFTQSLETGSKKAVDAAKQKVLDIVARPGVQNSKSGVVKWAAALTQVAVSGRAAAFMGNIRSFRDYMLDERDGMLAGLLREAKGPSDVLEALILTTKHAENGRQTAIAQTSDVLLKEFENGGKNLTKEEKSALTAVLLRSGAHHLMDTFSLPEIAQLLADPQALAKAIADTQAKLTSVLKDQHIEQAHGLGYWKATDLNASKFLMKNAHVIARMLGTQYAGRITESEASQEQETIATLATLYAIKYSSGKDTKAVAAVFANENTRTDGNGVELLLKMHREMEKESQERLFNNNPIQMTHGYTPEIYNPYITVKIANDLDGKDLIAQGYELVDSVASDKDVPDANGAYGVKQGIYVRKDGGLTRRVSGVMSLTSKQNKGTTIHNGYMNTNTYAGTVNASMQVEVTNKKLAALAQVGNPNRDFSKEKGVNVAPVYDDQGNVVNWAYMMGGQTRNNTLMRENRFEKIMGAFAGSIIDKHSGQELNEKAITALRDQHAKEQATSPWSYIEVSATSADPEMRELWNLLPADTRTAIRKVWGRDAISVRKDSLDGVFGYRKLSAADFLTKERADLVGAEKFVRGFFQSFARMRGLTPEQQRELNTRLAASNDKAAEERMFKDAIADNFAKRMAVYVMQGERGWQDIYKEVKDIIVVKNLVTLVGNVYSNASLLYLMGVDDGWSKQLVALRGIMAYETDHKKLMELEAKRDSGYGNADANEIARLKDAITRNPVTRLVDSGLMPTIVEDVDLNEDPYSYKSQLGEALEAYTNKVPTAVKQVAKTVYMTHDTPLYKLLSRATQYSDFIARFALYEHAVNNEGATHEQAVQKSLRAFVHYDVPMQRNLQYLDDMGLTPFMKYFYRIQRVLFETTKERPARVLGMVLLNRFADLGPIVLDSSVVQHVGNNPFRTGALRFPSSLDDLLTVQAGMALIK
jgi:hypothetical protein